ncbi:MAG TPA: rhomboid family intramembrane serine protease [Thermoclostridium sp.]
MRFLDRLERKLGRYAISGLMIYITIGNVAVFILDYLMPSLNITSKLALVPYYVFKGQIWRLVTYIFIPPESSIIFIFFVLYFYYIIGSSLENLWGSFRLNIYYLIGMVGTTIAALLTGYSDATHLNLSLFLAFAYLFPDYEILLFFIIPVKIKYLAWLNWAFIAFSVIFGPVGEKLAAIVSVLNFLLFFGPDVINRIKNRRNVYYNRKNFYRQIEEGRRANRENMRK